MAENSCLWDCVGNMQPMKVGPECQRKKCGLDQMQVGLCGAIEYYSD